MLERALALLRGSKHGNDAGGRAPRPGRGGARGGPARARRAARRRARGDLAEEPEVAARWATRAGSRGRQAALAGDLARRARRVRRGAPAAARRRRSRPRRDVGPRLGGGGGGRGRRPRRRCASSPRRSARSTSPSAPRPATSPRRCAPGSTPARGASRRRATRLEALGAGGGALARHRAGGSPFSRARAALAAAEGRAGDARADLETALDARARRPAASSPSSSSGSSSPRSRRARRRRARSPPRSPARRGRWASRRSPNGRAAPPSLPPRSSRAPRETAARGGRLPGVLLPLQVRFTPDCAGREGRHAPNRCRLPLPRFPHPRRRSARCPARGGLRPALGAR